MTLIRTFNHQILDMLELHIDPESFRSINQFKTKKCATGLKPMIAFHGSAFENPNQTKYTLAKSLFLDLFRGQEAQSVDVEGLQYMISISAEEEEDDDKPAPLIHFRVFLIKTKKSGQKVPRVEVEEMGPRIDFRVGRERFADEGMWKEALKKPKGTEVCGYYLIDDLQMTDWKYSPGLRRILKLILWATRSARFTLESRTSSRFKPER